MFSSLKNKQALFSWALLSWAIASWTLPSQANAQEADLIYDDGTPAGVLDTLSPGDIEATRMTPAHPAQVTSVSLYFATAGCTAQVRIWADNGGNAADLDTLLYQADVTVDATGWFDVQIPADTVVLDPPSHFYVGHVLDDPACGMAWDATGTEEIRSMARIDGSWYFIGDPNNGSQGLDALIRATVSYFDVLPTRHFENTTEAAGLPQGMSRMAWGDFDDDGLDDLLVSGKQLFHNNGDGTFTEVTEEAGIGGYSTNGGVWADYNNDGHLDFYATVNNYLPSCVDASDCVWCTLETTPQGTSVCDEYIQDHTCEAGRCTPPSRETPHDLLWENNGDGTFSDVSEIAGQPYDFLPSEAAAWGDFDNDGYVDLYVANYETPRRWAEGALSQGNLDYLWKNNGDGTFSDVSEEAGVRGLPEQCGRGVAWADYDEDGDLDLYVTNYRLDFNFFWRNNGDGTFENISGSNGTAGELIGSSYGHSIGASWSDVDLDGDWDLFVANLAHPRFIEFSDKSMLYLSSGAPDYVFEEHRQAAGIPYSETHSDPAWGDYDNDGLEDLFLTDIYVGYKAFLYRNDGDAQFTDVTYPSGIDLTNGWGCAWADYDNDGKIDLVSRSLWRNQAPNMNHWLKIRLRGVASNSAAIGAVVEVTAAGRTMKRQVEGGKGTGNQNSLTLHFGLGDAQRADLISIYWPSGLQEEYPNVDADQTVTYWEGGELSSDAGVATDGGTTDASPGTNGGGSGSSSGCGCRTAHPPSQRSHLPLPLLIFLFVVTLSSAWARLSR